MIVLKSNLQPDFHKPFDRKKSSGVILLGDRKDLAKCFIVAIFKINPSCNICGRGSKAKSYWEWFLNNILWGNNWVKVPLSVCFLAVRNFSCYLQPVPLRCCHQWLWPTPNSVIPTTPPDAAAPFTQFFQPRSVHMCSCPCTKHLCYLNRGLLFHSWFHICGPGLRGLCKKAVWNQPVPTLYRELDVSTPWHRRWNLGKILSC